MEPASPTTICIIDPVSPEFNRGSFCYLPYIVYSAMKAYGTNVQLIENFCAADIDKLPKAEQYLIALWSHPQIEHVRTLLRFLPKNKASVFGYKPLIEVRQFPLHIISDKIIREGISSYPAYFDNFKQILLSDCDMHLKAYKGQVYPMFTSYGCPNGCSFCPSTTNQPHRITFDENTVKYNLLKMYDAGRTNIHFTDEDFFFDIDRANRILKFIKDLEKDFQLIALAERKTLLNYLGKYGNETLRQAGMKLIEVGLETASPYLTDKMCKGDMDNCYKLAKMCKIPILWLTMTFFPGETIETLKTTGDFLRKHGLPADRLYSRITTNGTVGGLGQFFQPYEGTKKYDVLQHLGEILTTRPLRLLPSFLPDSFKRSVINKVHLLIPLQKYWYDLYNVNPPDFRIEKGYLTVEQLIELYPEWNTRVDAYISLAISARLGVIE